MFEHICVSSSLRPEFTFNLKLYLFFCPDSQDLLSAPLSNKMQKRFDSNYAYQIIPMRSTAAYGNCPNMIYA
jgi:hypothetical protein